MDLQAACLLISGSGVRVPGGVPFVMRTAEGLNTSPRSFMYAYRVPLEWLETGYELL